MALTPACAYECPCASDDRAPGPSTSAHGAEKGRESMRPRKLARALMAALVISVLVAGAQSAQAAFPNFTDCPATNIATEACIDIQNRSGNLRIKEFNVPLGESLEIRGALKADERGNFTIFLPARGSNGFFARAVPVPGGIFGIEWLPGNSVLAITELAGSASDIHIDITTQTIRMPIKVRLVNVLLGMDCHIGTNTRPVVLTLITGTTSPPAPNRPISGRLGTLGASEGILSFTGNLNVENSFAVPGATECGLGLGLINALVNLRLRLPSAAGNNSVEVVNDVAIRVT